MKVAAYVRVSTEDQTHDSQRSELEHYCRHRGWQPEWFVDTASGAQRDRSELNRLMRMSHPAGVEKRVSHVWRRCPVLIRVSAGKFPFAVPGT